MAAINKALMGRSRRRELSEDQKAEVKEAFELFDTDKDDKLDYQEFKVALKALGVEQKKAEVLKIMNQYDFDGSGKIQFTDFQDVVTDMLLERDPTTEIMKAFELFDDDGSGKISLKNLRRVARELGEKASDEELRAMIEEFDSSGTGEISKEDFISIMTGEAV